MKRTGRVVLIILLIVSCMIGLWVFWNFYIRPSETKEECYENAYVTTVSGSSVTVLWKEKTYTWNLSSEITEDVTGVTDVYVAKDRVTRFVRKPETIRDKVLKITEKAITFQEYGKVGRDNEFAVYKKAKNGSISLGSERDIVVGYSNVAFIAAGGKICAAIVEETELKTIRVMLTNQNAYEMDKVVLTATTDYTVSQGNETKTYQKGQIYRCQKAKKRLKVQAASGGKIQIKSITKQGGIPSYRGTIEIEPCQDKFRIINELTLEEYLYGVVPSEMPASYEKEALKAQAVCARSYAVQQIKGRRMAKYGAHVDDTVSYQVYNNWGESEAINQAVKETKGQIVTYKGKVANTYFYSASCGSSAGTKDVWMAKKEETYLPSRYQNEKATESNLAKEEDFIRFLKGKGESFDSSSPWYRWHVTVSVSDLQKAINAGIKKRYAVNKSQIQTLQKDGTYKSVTPGEVGKLQKISIVERGKGGVVSLLEIKGSKNTIRIYTEYNIRTILNVAGVYYKRNDNSEVTGLSLLPSGFFYLSEKDNQYEIQGGGYGHGVGMSQNGANAMARKGKTFEEILMFYFPGTTLQYRKFL